MRASCQFGAGRAFRPEEPRRSVNWPLSRINTSPYHCLF